jgi:hypothetical protein
MTWRRDRPQVRSLASADEMGIGKDKSFILEKMKLQKG